MVRLSTPLCDFNWKAPDFRLQGIDGQLYNLKAVAGEKATLVMFICNHCPYVLSIIDELVEECADLQTRGCGIVAICSNDSQAYPEDGFEQMKIYATQWKMTFPYLHDLHQTAAQDYGAVCTPDFFGFDQNLGLQYRGRFDDRGKDKKVNSLKSQLYQAMDMICSSQVGPQSQHPSIGCSIKWKE